MQGSTSTSLLLHHYYLFVYTHHVIPLKYLASIKRIISRYVPRNAVHMCADLDILEKEQTDNDALQPSYSLSP